MKLSIQEFLTRDGRIRFGNGWMDWMLLSEVGFRREFSGSRWGIWATIRTVGGGVWESRLDFGSGYRIHFGKDGPTIILLLVAGDKSSQTRDIAQAQAFWKAYQ